MKEESTSSKSDTVLMHKLNAVMLGIFAKTL